MNRLFMNLTLYLLITLISGLTGCSEDSSKDNEPPSTPTTLAATAVSSSQINLSWNGSTDNIGVKKYTITRNDGQTFTSSSTAYSNTELSPVTEYSYTVRASDSAENESGASNSASATTLDEGNNPADPDTTPPAEISDFSVSCELNDCTLSWTATGDDQHDGTASEYDIRYSAYEITGDTQFNNALVPGNKPAPQVSGSRETFSVPGLEANTTYHFAIKVMDEVPNMSDISSVSGTTNNSSNNGPTIVKAADTSAMQGDTYSFTPSLSSGSNVRWRKVYGPDSMTIDPDTGSLSWAIPSELPGESFYIGVKAVNSHGEDTQIWILTVGDGNVIYVGQGETSTTISEGTATATAGDTIIVRDSTTPLTDPDNRIYNAGGSRGTWPPNGNSKAYSTIMAESPGGVFIDGENTGRPVYGKGSYVSFDDDTGSAYTLEYIAVKGFVAGRSSASGPITLSHTNHIKIMHCGVFDQASDSGAAINIARSGFTLIESCYIYGHFREAIMHWLSEYTILRRNIARRDGNASHQPLGGFVHYASRDSHIQNSIIIDFDRTDYIVDQTYTAGAFESDCGASCHDQDRQIRNLYNHSCLSLNTDDRTASLSQPTDLSEYTTPRWDNIVVWDQRMWWNGPESRRYPGSSIRSKGDSIWNQCTFGELSSPLGSIEAVDHSAFFNGYSDASVAGDQFYNSIFYNFVDYDTTPGDVSTFFTTLDFNNAYSVGVVSKQGNDTNTRTLNPNFKYITRLESGNPLLISGRNTDRIGADLTYMRGVGGTMYGEPGYDDDTTTPMWPFPGEDVMKEKMKAYTYDGGNLTGNRGFAAYISPFGSPSTLTSYVWEYLGNKIPDEIY